MAPNTELTIEELSDYFHMPEKQVAAKMGMCLTSLKKICRSHGITRWPFRKLKSLERTMKKMNEDSQQIGAMTTVSAASPVLGSSSPFASTSDSTSRGSSRSPVQGVGKMVQGEASTLASKPNRLYKTETGDDEWPTCTVSGADMRRLVVRNWSTFWTVQNMRKHLLAALGGTSLRFSEDGCKAYLEFSNSLAAVQARTVCEQACAMLRERMEATNTGDSVPATEVIATAAASLQRQTESVVPVSYEEPVVVAATSLQDVHGDLVAQIGSGAPTSSNRPETREMWSNNNSFGAPPSFAPLLLPPLSNLAHVASALTSPPVSLNGPVSSCSSHSGNSGEWCPNPWAQTYVSC
jgi:hypothetical protein